VAGSRFGEKLSADKVESFLRRARNSFEKWGFVAGSPKNTVADFWNLELISHDDQLNAIGSILREIEEGNYSGPHPPDHKSREPKCKGAQMLQFVWHSKCFGGKEMCFKFCMVDERLAVLRIHEAYNPNLFEG
jgi:hypothetical protein